MKNKKRIARASCMSMALLMAFSSFSFAAEKATKEETVYVNLSHEGKVVNIIVSDWLHSEEMDVEFDDVSTLEGIRNVKGEEVPVASGQSLSWKTEKGEIYYQGTTAKKLPIEFELKYKLDGKPVSPELLAGRTGKLEIRMRVTNNEAHDVMLSSGSKRLFTPFAVAAVFNFPTDKCRNISVNTGKVINDGNTSIVTYASVPGLEESLDIDDDDFDEMFDLPEELVLEADVNDFEMGDILITAASDSSILNDIEGFDDMIEETEDGVWDLSDASEEVKSGIEELSDGTWDLLRNFGDFNEGMFSLEDAVSELEENINGRILDGSIDLYDGAEEFWDKTGELKDGTEELQDGSEDLEDGIRSAYLGAVDLKDGSEQLTAGIEQMIAEMGASSMDTDSVGEAVEYAVKNAVEGAVAAVIAGDDSLTEAQAAYLEAAASAAGEEAGAAAGAGVKASLDEKMGELMTKLGSGFSQLLAGAQALEVGMGTLTSGLWELEEGSEELNDGMKTLDENADLFQDGAEELAGGAAELMDGLGALGQGAEKLKEGATGLADASNTANKGIGTLQSGAQDLFDGYETFSEEGVEELRDKVVEKTDEYYELFEIKESLADLSSRYENFSGISESMEGKLKFVIKIDGIEAEDEKVEAPVVEKEDTGFIAWVKNKWKHIFKK
ncbi:MAG: hypothetical protein C0604_03245 [Clostridiales bacterium]|nr:MAG: hypothetical protein C0604_03245 [Clostridiales bacterium]